MTLEIKGSGTIYYKISTDDATGEYRKYTKPLKIVQDSTVKAYCVVDGKKSKVTTGEINRRPYLNVSHKSGMYETGITVKFTHYDCFCVQARETKIYYTLDGSKPTKKSKVYSSKTGIYIRKNTMLRIMTVSENGRCVAYDSFNYFILKNSLLDDYEEKYHYNKLNDKEKKVYRQMFKAAKKGNYLNLKENIDTAWNATVAFFDDNPQYFAESFVIRSPKKYAEQIVMLKNTDYPTLSVQVKKKICDMMGAPCKTEKEQIKKIHDVLCKTIVYTDEEDGCYDAAGAIIKGKAVCQGYAMAFTYLCQLYGINCSMVRGEVSTGGHAWNIVKVGERWLYMDVCWDDYLSTYNYYLKTEKQMSKTHTLKKTTKEIG